MQVEDNSTGLYPKTKTFKILFRVPSYRGEEVSMI